MAPDTWYASPQLPWPREVKNLETKLRVADRVAAWASDGDCIGMGSGSSADLALWAIGRRAKAEGLTLSVIPSSYETEIAAATLGLPLARLGQAVPDWAVDGADEVDPQRRVLKGRGGALFKEKLLWHRARRIALVIDSSKHVDRLGSGFPMPVEVHPNAVESLVQFLDLRDCREATVRTGSGKDGPVITELGCFIVDARFDEIPQGIHAEIKQIPGVIETGLFEGYEFEIFDDA